MIATSAQDRASNSQPFSSMWINHIDNCKAQSASEKIDCKATMQTVAMQQSFLIVISQGAMTTTDECKGRSNRLPCNNQTFMLSFAGCDDDRTAPHDDQRHKYAEVEYREYAKDRLYIAKGVYVTKGKYIEYAKEVVYVAKGKYGEYWLLCRCLQEHIFVVLQEATISK